MTHVNGVVAIVLAVLILQSCTGSSKAIQIGKAEPNPELAKQFNNVFQDGDFYFAGIPTEAGLTSVSQQGVTVVVNLLPDNQQTHNIPFNEPALVHYLGMAYESIPMVPSSFSTDDVDRLAVIIDKAEGKVLIHCASSNRVGGLWAAYLHRHRGYDLEEAIELGMAAGLRPGGMTEAVKRVADEPAPD